MNNTLNKQESHIVIQKDSLFELTISKKYLGQISLATAKDLEPTMQRYELFEDKHTAIFGKTNEKNCLLTVTKIEGICFLAGARSAASLDRNQNPHSFVPILPSANAGIRSEFPLMNFVVRPPQGRSMYAIIDWQNSRFVSLWILISIQDKEGNIKLFRAPIPNSHVEGNICTGSLKFKNYSVENVKDVIHRAMTDGFNADLSIDYEQFGEFAQKDNTPVAYLWWKKPMHKVAEQLTSNRRNPMLEDMDSIVSAVELSNNKKQALPIKEHGIETKEKEQPKPELITAS